MTTIADIFTSAFNKDAVGLKAAINDIMTSKVADAVDAKFPDVAASMFGATIGQDEEVDSNDYETSDQEEPTDENV
jgi:hypothetical protein